MGASWSGPSTRRELLTGGVGLLALTSMLVGASRPAEARDYASRREALDDLDRLDSLCRARLGAVGKARQDAELLVSRFLARLQAHRRRRDEVRRRLAAGGPGAATDPRSGTDPVEPVDAALTGLRQALDDLMIAYAEALPVLADARAVSGLAVDMVEVSRLRTVIDLWVVAEEP